jgi:hypothetical protein
MLPVATAALAELCKLQTARGSLLVLGRGVVTFLALRALQCDDFAHLRILTDSVPICSILFLADFPRRLGAQTAAPIDEFPNLSDDFRDSSGAYGTTAFADRKT